MKRVSQYILLALLFFTSSCSSRIVDILIVGGGASGTAAAIQASRMGANVMIVEETPWLGGMLTSAGVSCIDGNYNLRSGIFGEFTDSLAAYYGGYDKLKTGWVSLINFEPDKGEEIFENMVASCNSITLLKQAKLLSIKKEKGIWIADIQHEGKVLTTKAKVLIDGTELGDLIPTLSLDYRVGMDSKYDTAEDIAPEKGNDIIQDMTYVVVLKDYGPDADMTIEMPTNYSPEKFSNSAISKFNKPEKAIQRIWSPKEMIRYGALPNGRYMINWPIEGNDYYANTIECSPQQRDSIYRKAKEFSLEFIYFIQTELGMKNLGIADDIFPSEDGMPLFPYHRESRRVYGEAFFTIDAAASPYSFKYPYYRTGIAVGDYAVDHHHFRHPQWNTLPDLHFYPIPSYSLPLGSLIPSAIDNFIVTEKSISVSNIINGTTRLQPVVMQIGQAAGALAALACRDSDVSVKSVSIRELQDVLLQSSCYIMPYLDQKPTDPLFYPIQRIGATGIIRGEGRNVGWSNQTWFRTNDILKKGELFLSDYYDVEEPITEGEYTVTDLLKVINGIIGKNIDHTIIEKGLDSPITRGEAAILIDTYLDPFHNFEINYKGEIIK